MVYLPLRKNEFVSWDDDISSICKVIKAMFQTTNQEWYSTVLDIECLIFLITWSIDPSCPQHIQHPQNTSKIPVCPSSHCQCHYDSMMIIVNVTCWWICGEYLVNMWRIYVNMVLICTSSLIISITKISVVSWNQSSKSKHASNRHNHHHHHHLLHLHHIIIVIVVIVIVIIIFISKSIIILSSFILVVIHREHAYPN